MNRKLLYRLIELTKNDENDLLIIYSYMIDEGIIENVTLQEFEDTVKRMAFSVKDGKVFDLLK